MRLQTKPVYICGFKSTQQSMAVQSSFLGNSLAKKYWMALTGLFLCLFLVIHLAGNLSLIWGTGEAFNEYTVFMTSFPPVKIVSYLLYFSILFHAVDGILILTMENKKARPIDYAYNKPEKNSDAISSKCHNEPAEVLRTFFDEQPLPPLLTHSQSQY